MKTNTLFQSRPAILRRWATIGGCGFLLLLSLAARAQLPWVSPVIVVIHAKTADGSKPEGVVVRIQAAHAAELAAVPPEPAVEGTNGDWVAPKVPKGQWEVTLSGGDFATIGPVPLPIVSGNNYTMSFILERGATLQGRVVDAGTGKPMSGARLKLKALEATSDGNGNYEIRHAAAGTDSILVEATNFVTQNAEVAGVTAGATVAVPDIQLHRGGWIAGRVVLPGDAPSGAIATVVPTVEGNSVPPGVVLPEGRMSASGTFRVGPLPAGTYRVHANPQSPTPKQGTRPSWLAYGEATGVKVEEGKDTAGVAIPTKTTWPPQPK